MRLAALVLLALTLAACESNQERSAKLEKAAKLTEREALRRRARAQQALTITRQSSRVKVIATAVVHSSEGAAAIVTLRNVSSTTLLDVPIQITVRDARGATVYRNDIPGLSPTLLSAALLPAHGVLTWIDDQIQATGVPASVSAEVGEGRLAGGAIAHLNVEGTHITEGDQAEGNLVNHSTVAQQELVIDAVARRAGKVVAAGRAVLADVPGGTSAPFQIFFVGDPSAARLEVSAAATTPG